MPKKLNLQDVAAALIYRRIDTSKTHQAGTYELVDTRDDTGWGDVVAVERHWNSQGTLTTVTNHRDWNMAIGPFLTEKD